MGNCAFRGFAEAEDLIRVVTSTGGVMELCAPITAECITNEFPGHAIFRSGDYFSRPLLHSEELVAGELYRLLPLRPLRGPPSSSSLSAAAFAPYRMSLDGHGGAWRRVEAEGVPSYSRGGDGVWKVRLVISPEQLVEILSQESRTEELIESVRTVAKCGGGLGSSVNSDQWSLSSSWKAASSSSENVA